jgi:hypothetical protein
MDAEVPAHEQVRHLTEIEILPEHAQRTESPEFAKNRALLLSEGHGRCLTCGRTDNLQLHHLLEWALWDALDPAKALALLRRWNIDPYGKLAADPDSPMRDPDDIRNLVFLCEEHHIGAGTGIHSITFPVCIAQGAAREGAAVTAQQARDEGIAIGKEGER